MTRAVPTPTRQRRWFQVTLRLALLVMTLASLLLVGWRIKIRPYQQQRLWIGRFADMKANVQTRSSDDPLLKLWSGKDPFEDIVQLDLTAATGEPSDYLPGVIAAPRLEALAVAGKSFTDEHLARLRRVTSLKLVVIDSTSVTNDAIRQLLAERPDLEVRRGYHSFLTELAQSGGVVQDYLAPGRPKNHPFPILAPQYFRVPQKLDLRALDMSADVLDEVSRLSRLESLRLGINVYDEQVPLLLRLANLRHLDLSLTNVSEDSLPQLARLTRLRLLALGRNFTDEGMPALAAFDSLVFVDLERSQVTTAGLAVLTELPNLEKVNLAGRPIDDAGMDQLARVTTLREVQLGGCKDITDAGFLRLVDLPKLKNVALQRTRISPACLARLREARPDVDFDH